MKTARLFALLFVAPSLAAACYGASGRRWLRSSWNQAAAAHYLDSREIWWQSWDAAKRDHGTVCVSCHTVLPYALSRSSLRGSLGEAAHHRSRSTLCSTTCSGGSRMWNQVQPFYPNSKSGPTLATDSRATESVLNALILSTYDQQKNHLTDITRSAFDNMWALQIKSGEQAGAWDWQNFHLAPWESNESQYNGAVLAAIAVGRAPDNYRTTPKFRRICGCCVSFLRREYDAQPLLNKVYVLWASARLPGLLNEKERSALVATLASKQQPDGGWSLNDLGTWKEA